MQQDFSSCGSDQSVKYLKFNRKIIHFSLQYVENWHWQSLFSLLIFELWYICEAWKYLIWENMILYVYHWKTQHIYVDKVVIYLFLIVNVIFDIKLLYIGLYLYISVYCYFMYEI